ncbi:helix-turn-helix transcriptional regulator [Chromobacterium violaceum]|uniref:helix-turn-helix transcriptional regulator n=1 Tax=Chromobacterium violaceum TaxID=536 RepID=UPI001B31BF40|nr:AraC family transcriptional regulator [Chromobacterium violaceum]MBP4043640.1 helix-turn-helix domain-containing protein [Chromobacterium violaceum]
MDAVDLPFHCQALQGVSRGGTASHVHAVGQLIYLRRGAMLCQSETMRWLMAAGQVGWIPAGVAHSAEPLAELYGVTAYADSAAYPDLPAEVRVMPAGGLMGLLLERQLRYEAEPWPGRRQRLAGAIVDELLQLAPLPQHLPLPAERRLRALCRRVLADLGRGWLLDELAAAHGFSRASLTRAFARETGVSFGHWLAQARLLEAVRLLSGGAMVGETALQVGYQSPSAFCAAFRRHLGMAPGELQRAQARV